MAFSVDFTLGLNRAATVGLPSFGELIHCYLFFFFPNEENYPENSADLIKADVKHIAK